MRTPRISFAARIALPVLAVLLAGSAAHAARFEFDQRRTEVYFTYTMALAPHRGRFTSVAGTLEYDEARPENTRVTAAIATASLSTGYTIIDDELKGASFFNAEAAPVIAFKSRVVKPTGAGRADVVGDITVNGVTKPVILKVDVRPHFDPAIGGETGTRVLVARTRIQRSAFRMTDWQLMVADDVDIEIRAIVRQRK